MQFSAFISSIFLARTLASPAPCSYECIDLEVPMSFKAPSLQPSFPPFENHYESVAYLGRLTARNAKQLPSPIKGVNNDTQVDVTIAAQYCYPTKNAGKVVQILSHGLGFDHSYWNFGGMNSPYNYVKAATDSGYPTLSYDRLGCGKSTVTDPYTISQIQIEAEVLAILTQHLRTGDHPAFARIPKPEKIVHVGHSFGSMITDKFVAVDPSASDGIVLSAFSPTANSEWFISSNAHLASEDQPRRFRGRSSGYLTNGGEQSNQYGFFYWPYFDPKVLAEAEKTKWPIAVGEMLTAGATIAPNFTGPVMVISGQYDRIFCEADCYGFLEGASSLFPAAKPFQTYVQPNTGHGLNLHFNSTGTYKVINDFVKTHVRA